MTSFTCDFHGVDLCGNGGVCASPPRTGCDCAKGYVRDFTVFHDRSCFLPDWYHMFFLVVSTSISWILLPFIANETRKLPSKSRTKRIGTVAMIAVFANWMYSVGLYVQNGAYEMCAVSLTVSAIFHLECGLDMVRTMTTISRAASFEESHKFLTRVTMLVRTMDVAWIACMSAMLARCRREDDAPYNLAVCMFFFTNLVAVASLGPIIYYSCDVLLKIMFDVAKASVVSPSNQSSKERKFGDVKSRVRRLRRTVMFMTANNIFSLAPLPVIHLVLGSFPYFFVVIVLFCCTLSGLDAGVLLFLRKKKFTTSASRSASDKGGNGEPRRGGGGGGGGGDGTGRDVHASVSLTAMSSPTSGGDGGRAGSSSVVASPPTPKPTTKQQREARVIDNSAVVDSSDD